MKKLLPILLALGAFAPLGASAKPYHVTPVSWIVATRNNISVDDRYVTIIGHVTRRMGDEEYWFSDGTGSVRLDSENFDLPVGPRLIIGGRIDQAYLGFGHIEVDVRHWRYAPGHKPVAKTTAATTPPPMAPAPIPAPAPTPAPTASTPPPAPVPASAPPASTTPAPAAQTAPATNASPLTPPAESH